MKKLFLTTIIFAVFGLVMNAQQVTYDFNDGSWGDAAAERPTSGSFSSSDINGVKLNSSVVFQKDGKGSTRIIMDKRSTKSNIEFPEFTGAKKDVIIDASVGTDAMTMSLEQKVDNKWVAVGEPTVLTKQKASYSFTISDKAKQIRIVNPTNSAVYVYKVVIK